MCSDIFEYDHRGILKHTRGGETVIYFGTNYKQLGFNTNNPSYNDILKFIGDYGKKNNLELVNIEDSSEDPKDIFYFEKK